MILEKWPGEFVCGTMRQHTNNVKRATPPAPLLCPLDRSSIIKDMATPTHRPPDDQGPALTMTHRVPFSEEYGSRDEANEAVQALARQHGFGLTVGTSDISNATYSGAATPMANPTEEIRGNTYTKRDAENPIPQKQIVNGYVESNKIDSLTSGASKHEPIYTITHSQRVLIHSLHCVDWIRGRA